MFFNRLEVKRENGFFLVHFGLLSNASSLLDSYSCILPQQALVQNQKSLLEYLERIGLPKEKNPQSWEIEKSRGKIDVADIVNMAFHDKMAETCLCVFSMTAATWHRPESSSDTLEAQPLVLLRSAVEMQKQLIEALYAE